MGSKRRRGSQASFRRRRKFSGKPKRTLSKTPILPSAAASHMCCWVEIKYGALQKPRLGNRIIQVSTDNVWIPVDSGSMILPLNAMTCLQLYFKIEEHGGIIICSKRPGLFLRSWKATARSRSLRKCRALPPSAPQVFVSTGIHWACHNGTMPHVIVSHFQKGDDFLSDFFGFSVLFATI